MNFPILRDSLIKPMASLISSRNGESKRAASIDHIHDSKYFEQLLFLGRGLNFNVTTDQVIERVSGNAFTKFIVTRVRIFDASISLSTAQGGIYTAEAKGGVGLMATTHAFSTLDAATKGMDATLAAVGLDELTADELWLSLTTAQGAAATASVAVIGIPTV